MPTSLPYIFSPAILSKGFEKINAAATPERFTQEFLEQTIGMKGGNYRMLIPYLKKIGFSRATERRPKSTNAFEIRLRVGQRWLKRYAQAMHRSLR